MKIKTDFVTNSSSSSFILSSPRQSLGKVHIMVEVDLDRYVRSKISNRDDLFRYYREEYGRDYTPEPFDNMLKAIDEGKNIYLLEAYDDSEDSFERFLCTHGLDSISMDDIDVLQGEGGY